MLSGDKLRDQGTLAILVAEDEDVHTDMLGERKLHWIQRELNGTGVVTKRVVGPEETTPKSARSQRSQMISSAVDVMARSSALVLERETPVCFMDFQVSNDRTALTPPHKLTGDHTPRVWTKDNHAEPSSGTW